MLEEDDYGGKEELTGMDARKQIVKTYTGKRSEKGRNDDMRDKLGFKPKERKLIHDTIEGEDD